MLSGLPYVVAVTAGGGGCMRAEGTDFSASLPNGFEAIASTSSFMPLRIRAASGERWGLDFGVSKGYEFSGSITYQTA